MDHSVRRYDFAPIQGSEETPEGYLRVWCRAAKTGTQVYRRADGSQVREYRPPEEVSSPDSLSTFGMKPVTWTHPSELLDSENTKHFQIGYSGSQVRYNDGFVEVALTITDKDAIEKIKRRDATEVSAGYKVDYDPTPGTTENGDAYNGIQRNIRVNHIAVVPRGRAGPDVRLLLDRMDSSDAVSFPSEEPAFQPVPTTPGSPTMATVKLDGMEIELPTDVASAVQSFVRDAERRLDAASREATELKENVDSLKADLQTAVEARDAAKSRVDALETELNEQPRLDSAAFHSAVQQHVSLLLKCAPRLPDDFVLDGLSKEEIYAATYTELTGNAPREDANPDETRARVEGILAYLDAQPADSDEDDEKEAEGEELMEDSMKGSAKAGKKKMDEEAARGDSTTALRDALGGVRRVDESPTTTYRMKLQEAWKQPLTATK